MGLPSKKDILQNANEVAQKMGYENARIAQDAIRANLNSNSPLNQRQGVQDGQSYLNDLILLTLKQVIEPNYRAEYVGAFANMYDDGGLDEGNSKIYIKTLPTGNDSYSDVANSFVPSARTNPQEESVVVQMYSAVNTLAENSFQYHKALTLSEALGIPYFKAGNLNVFVERIIEQIYESYELGKFDNITTFIMNQSQTFKKQITGQGADLFESIQEFLIEINKMQQLNGSYMIGDTKVIKKTDIKDLVVIMSNKTKQLLQSGIKSQLFNAHLLNLKNVISDENIGTLGNKILIGDPNTVITVDESSPYLADNTIVVYERGAFRGLQQVRTQGQQNYAKNMTNEIDFHSGGTKTMLPGYQGLVYKNPNLNILPASEKDATSY